MSGERLYEEAADIACRLEMFVSIALVRLTLERPAKGRELTPIRITFLISDGADMFGRYAEGRS